MHVYYYIGYGLHTKPPLTMLTVRRQTPPTLTPPHALHTQRRHLPIPIISLPLHQLPTTLHTIHPRSTYSPTLPSTPNHTQVLSLLLYPPKNPLIKQLCLLGRPAFLNTRPRSVHPVIYFAGGLVSNVMLALTYVYIVVFLCAVMLVHSQAYVLLVRCVSHFLCVGHSLGLTLR